MPQVSSYDSNANLLVGRIYLKKGDLEDASYHAKFVLMNDPESHEALILLAQIKMKKNVIFGVYWNISASMSSLRGSRAALILISAYLVVNLVTQIMYDLKFENLAKLVSYSWVALVIYSWIGIPYFHKVLKKELDSFSFNKDF